MGDRQYRVAVAMPAGLLHPDGHTITPIVLSRSKENLVCPRRRVSIPEDVEEQAWTVALVRGPEAEPEIVSLQHPQVGARLRSLGEVGTGDG